MNSCQIVGAVMLLAGAIVFGAGLIAHAIVMAGHISRPIGDTESFLGGLFGFFGLICLLGGSVVRKTP